MGSPPGLCLGGTAFAATCEANRRNMTENPLCGACREGYSYALGSQLCVECREARAGVLVGLWFISWSAVLLLHWLSQSGSSETKVRSSAPQLMHDCSPLALHSGSAVLPVVCAHHRGSDRRFAELAGPRGERHEPVLVGRVR